MNKLFFVAALVAISMAIVEATRIKIVVGDQDSKFASSMNLKPACNDLKEVDEKNFHHIGRYYALIKNRPVVKFYSSKTAYNQLGQALNKVLPGTQNTAGQFLKELRANGCPTYIFGGAVRDTLLGMESKDIDAETDCKPHKVLKICGDKFGYSLCHKRGVLVNFGHEEHVAEMVDLAPNSDTFYGSANQLEYSPNAVAFDYGEKNEITNVIIDLCGTAVDDTCSWKIRIPVPKEDWDAWATIRKGDNGKKIFRYWKLKAKGFKAYDKATEDYIIQEAEQHIKQNDGWFAMKKYYCSIIYGYNLIKFYGQGKNRREGCCWTREACQNFKTKTNMQKKAQHFKAIIFNDLKWQLPTCGDPNWGFF